MIQPSTAKYSQVQPSTVSSVLKVPRTRLCTTYIIIWYFGLIRTSHFDTYHLISHISSFFLLPSSSILDSLPPFESSLLLTSLIFLILFSFSFFLFPFSSSSSFFFSSLWLSFATFATLMSDEQSPRLDRFVKKGVLYGIRLLIHTEGVVRTAYCRNVVSSVLAPSPVCK